MDIPKSKLFSIYIEVKKGVLLTPIKGTYYVQIMFPFKIIKR